MQIHAEKQPLARNESTQPGKGTFQFNARRPETAPLNRLQALADSSPQVARLGALQAMADSGYSVAALGRHDALQGRFATVQCQPETPHRPNHTGLPDNLKAGIESLSGISMDSVRVHYNSPQPAQLNALAYTKGADIHVAPGQERHLPHEAWHVVQQAQGRVKPTLQLKEGVPVNDDRGLEREADEMGAKALQQKSDDRGSKPLPVWNTPAVQRRIGFEIETGIPFNKIDRSKPAFGDIYRPAAARDLKQSPIRDGSLTYSADTSPATHEGTKTEPFSQWGIVEAVTDPIDDGMEISAFEETAKGWLEQIIALKQKAQKSPPAVQLSGDYYIGLPSQQKYSGWDRIAPQVTVGVPLDQAAKVISQFNSSGLRKAARLALLYAKAAPAKAAAVVQALNQSLGLEEDDGVTELTGLLTLMMNYLTVGNSPYIAGKVGYFKNRPGTILYKSKLSTVSQNLKNSTNYGHSVLSSNENKNELKKLLLKESNRDEDEPLFVECETTRSVASRVTVGTWLTEVLDGTDDKIFDVIKNSYSDEITPDATNEVVIELRQQGFNLNHQNLKLEDFSNGLLAYMKKVYVANKAIKTHDNIEPSEATEAFGPIETIETIETRFIEDIEAIEAHKNIETLQNLDEIEDIEDIEARKDIEEHQVEARCCTIQ